MTAADVIFTFFHSSPFHQINLAPHNTLEFFLHDNKINETSASFGSKGHQKINIAIRTEIITSSRAKEGKFRNLPSATKGGEFVPRKFNR